MKHLLIILFSISFVTLNAQNVLKAYTPKRNSPTPKTTVIDSESEIKDMSVKMSVPDTKKSEPLLLNHQNLSKNLSVIKTSASKYWIVRSDYEYGLYDVDNKKLVIPIQYQYISTRDNVLYFLQGLNANTIFCNNNVKSCDLCEYVTKSSNPNKYVVYNEDGTSQIYNVLLNELSPPYQKTDTAIINLKNFNNTDNYDPYKKFQVETNSKYSNVQPLEYGINIYRAKNKSGKFELINSTYQKLFDDEYEHYYRSYQAFRYSDDHCFPFKNGKYGIHKINKDGTISVISECNIDTIVDYNYGYSIIRNGKESLTNGDFKEIYNSDFESKHYVRFIDELNQYTNYLLVNKSEGVIMLDMNGNTIWNLNNVKVDKFSLPDRMSQLPYFNYIKTENNKGELGLVDFTGQTILPCKFKSLNNINNQWVIVMNNKNMSGLYDTKSKSFILQPEYDLLLNTKKDIYALKNDNILKSSIVEASDLTFKLGDIKPIIIKIKEATEKLVPSKSGKWSTYTGSFDDGKYSGTGLSYNNKVITPPIFRRVNYQRTKLDSISKNVNNFLRNDKLIFLNGEKEFLFDLTTKQFICDNIEAEFNFISTDLVLCHSLDIDFIYNLKNNKKEYVEYISKVSNYKDRRSDTYFNAQISDNAFKIFKIGTSMELYKCNYISIYNIEDNLLIGQVNVNNTVDLFNDGGQILFSGKLSKEGILNTQKRLITVKNEKYGVIDFSGNQIFEHSYDYLAGGDQDSTLIFKQGKKYGLISSEKKVVLAPTNDFIESISRGSILKDWKQLSPRQPLYLVKYENGYSLMNHIGITLIPSHYSVKNIRESDGFNSAFYSVGDFEAGFQIYDESGKVISNEKFDLITSKVFREQVICKIDKKYFVYDLVHQKRVSNSFDILFRKGINYFGILDNEEYQVDITGKFVDQRL